MRKRTKGSGERIGGEPSRQKGWTWPQCEEDCEWEMTRRSMNNGSLPGDGDGGEEKGSGRRFLPGRLGGAVRSFVRFVSPSQLLSSLTGSGMYLMGTF